MSEEPFTPAPLARPFGYFEDPVTKEVGLKIFEKDLDAERLFWAGENEKHAAKERKLVRTLKKAQKEQNWMVVYAVIVGLEENEKKLLLRAGELRKSVKTK